MKKIVSVIIAHLLRWRLLLPPPQPTTHLSVSSRKFPRSQNTQPSASTKALWKSLEYTCRDYGAEAASGVETMTEKALYVYLPYGYDDTKEYNVLYLMHGAGEDERYWLSDERMGKSTCAMLDNMFENDTAEHTIFVAASTKPTSFCKGMAGIAASDTSEYGYVYREGVENFWQELRNDIIPLVETKYSTYAHGDVCPENMKSSRDHRGFAGFSMGSATTLLVIEQ